MQQQQQQDPYRARPYNATYHEYPQVQNAWNNIGENVPTWIIPNSNEKRNRFIIGAVVIIFLFLVSHHDGSKATVIQQTAAQNSVVDASDLDTQTNVIENVENGSSSKGLPGDNGPTPATYSNNNVSPSENNSKVTDNTSATGKFEIKSLQQPAELTYLLTYPMSGVSYTLHLFELTTTLNTATNHDNVFLHTNDHSGVPEPPLPTRSHSTAASPFWQSADPGLALPTAHILTQTYCDGFRSDSPLSTDYEFERGCRTVHNRDGTIAVTPRDHWDGEKRTVHLVRDPFSNVVSRFHAWRWEQAAEGAKEGNGVQVVRNFSFHQTAEEDQGLFREYCKAMDSNDPGYSGFVPPDNEEVRALLKDIPCGMEFLRYVEWHKLAIKMKHSSGTVEFGGVAKPSSNSLTIHYEDFSSEVKTDMVLSMIAGFLELDSIDLSKRPPYSAGRMYTGYFSVGEVKAVEKLVKIMLAHDSATWKLLERYFN